jgi:hypothetical protein
MKPVKAAGLGPMTDSAVGQTESAEVVEMDDAVLPGSQRLKTCLQFRT